MQPDQATRRDLRSQVETALREDLGDGDLTGLLIAEERRLSCTIHSREPGILCGTDWVDEVFRQLDERISIQWRHQDGDRLEPGALLCTLTGPARPLLSGERSALNFLQLLSATATATRILVEAITGTGCRILDTRKTIPGLRLAQKYAVLCGGGSNHRKGLYDGILIKENHILSAGSISAALAKARRIAPAGVKIEVEVETLDQLDEAIAAGADLVMLDNFSVELMAEAVQRTAGRCLLEASGNIGLDNLRQVAETGVDLISIGALTKNVKALDLSMRVSAAQG